MDPLSWACSAVAASIDPMTLAQAGYELGAASGLTAAVAPAYEIGAVFRACAPAYSAVTISAKGCLAELLSMARTLEKLTKLIVCSQ